MNQKIQIDVTARIDFDDASRLLSPHQLLALMYGIAQVVASAPRESKSLSIAASPQGER